MRNESGKTTKPAFVQYSPIIGIVLVVSGLLLLIDQQIKTKWISLGIPIVIACILIIAGYKTKKEIWLIPGFVILGISTAIFIIFQKILIKDTSILISWGIGSFALSWFLLFLSIKILKEKWPWWVLIIALISTAVSINFLLPEQKLLNYVYLVSLGIGLSFLLWGGSKKSLGLIIPGLLISTMGSGVFFAWSKDIKSNGLMETGIMLVWFALGWLLITVFSRIISKKFVWWPLIPGGVLAMVGSGLYIGGNPGNALGFVQNTGSIGLILFGVYLILLKFGINK